jgi:signal transduction histidine kinase/ligand-binding sensor domain-containing protein/DNA-binding response OmpR family regulator
MNIETTNTTLGSSFAEDSKYYKFLFILIILFLFFFHSIYSQNSDFTFDNIPINENMSTYIHCILQDRDGFLWFATNSGLYRYDGYSFLSYTHEPDDTLSLIDNKLTILYEDKLDNIWVGTWNGFEKLDFIRGTFTYYHYTPNSSARFPETYNNVWAICSDRNNMLWIGTSSCLLKFNPKKEEFTCFQYNSTDPGSISHYSVYSIFEDKEGSLWIGTRAGLDKYNFETGKFIHYWNDPGSLKRLWYDDNSMYRVNAILRDSKGIIWLGTAGGIVEFNPEDSTFSKYPLKLKNGFAIITSICEDVISDYLWVGTENGLYSFDKNSKIFTCYNTEGNYVYSESSGTIWIGGKTGIKKLDRTKHAFKKYPINKIAFEIINGKSSTLWICDYSVHEFLKFNIKKEQIIPYTFGNDKLYYVFPEGDLALIAKDSSFIIVDSLGNKNFYLNPSWKKLISSFSYLYKDNKGYWAGNSKGDLYFLKPKTNEILFIKNFKQQIILIFEDRLNKLWIATLVGKLFCYDQIKDTLLEFIHDIKDPTSISSWQIHQMYEDKKGRLWFATNSGLNRYEPSSKSFLSFSKKNGLQSNNISGILEDINGYLWLNTIKGISKFDPETSQFKNFDVSYGIEPATDASFNKGCITGNGEMYFGGAHGFTRFHPDSLKDNPFIPHIVITSFKKFDIAYPISNQISLPYDENFISFEFAALSYKTPERNQYAYKMEGLDKDWIHSGTRRYASYPNLNPGEYVFRVKGSNNDGIWNETGISVSIIIYPPWWKTNWAYILYAILIFNLIYFSWKMQLKRIRIKHEFEMNRFETKKLHEVDEIKSRFFANISHEFRTPLTLILGPSKQLLEKSKDDKTKIEADFIYRNAKKLNRLVDELLDISRIEAGEMKLKVCSHNLVSIVKENIQYFHSLAERKNITFKLNTVESEILVFVDKNKVEKILGNVLSNAFKFTPEGGEVEVEVSRKEKYAEIAITDTGIGIPQNRIDKIFDRFYQVDGSNTRERGGTGIGLSLTKELIELHKGRIEVISEEGKGSTFKIFLPFGKEHLKPEDICEEEIVNTNEQEKIVSNFDELNETKYKNEIEINLSDIIGKASVLIVEDNADVRNYIKLILENEYNIYEAGNGEEGINKSLDIIPDLIISDLMMPKLDGFKLCAVLKNDTKTSHIPIIMLTAKSTIQDKVDGLEIGADEYIMKPFEAMELKARIQNLLIQRKRLHEHFQKYGLFEIAGKKINSVDQKFLQNVIKLINTHIADTAFSVESLADELAVSRSLLLKKTVALIGEAPRELIKRTRLNKAAKLIENNFGNISEISLEVGFNNPSHFAECFKKQFGCAPSQYNHKSINI